MSTKNSPSESWLKGVYPDHVMLAAAVVVLAFGFGRAWGVITEAAHIKAAMVEAEAASQSPAMAAALRAYHECLGQGSSSTQHGCVLFASSSNATAEWPEERLRQEIYKSDAHLHRQLSSHFPPNLLDFILHILFVHAGASIALTVAALILRAPRRLRGARS